MSVSEKLQEQLDSQEAVVLVDSKGKEIHESPGTQGLHNSLYTNMCFLYVCIVYMHAHFNCTCSVEYINEVGSNPQNMVMILAPNSYTIHYIFIVC